MEDQNLEWLSSTATAKLLRMPIQRLTRMQAQGELPDIRVERQGHRRRYAKADVRARAAALPAAKAPPSAAGRAAFLMLYLLPVALLMLPVACLMAVLFVLGIAPLWYVIVFIGGAFALLAALTIRALRA